MSPVNVIDPCHDIVVERDFNTAKRVFQLLERRCAKDHGSHERTLHRPGKRHLRQVELMVRGKLAIGVDRRPESW